jgi:hypothetical protein
MILSDMILSMRQTEAWGGGSSPPELLAIGFTITVRLLRE